MKVSISIVLSNLTGVVIMADKEPELLYIPLKDIQENPVALRGVDKKDEKYLSLVDSIKKNGVLNAITVRPLPGWDGDVNKPRYSVVDGLQRYTASCDAGRDTIPAQIISKNDAEVLEAQIIANLIKIDTKPAAYSKQLHRLMVANPLLTNSEMASRLSQSVGWLNDRLGLIKLKPEIQIHVDEGRIKVTNAVALSKLPEELQDAFVERAMTQTPAEFLPACQVASKQHRQAIMQGRDPKQIGFEPAAFLQKMSEIKDAVENPNELARTLIASANPQTPEEIFALGLKWVLHLDPKSVQAQREKWEAEERKKKEAKEAAKKEREEKKQREAQAAIAAVA